MSLISEPHCKALFLFLIQWIVSCSCNELCSIGRSAMYGLRLLKNVCPRLSRSPRKGKTWDPLNVAGGKKQTVFSLNTIVRRVSEMQELIHFSTCTVGEDLSPVSGAHLSLPSVTLFKIQPTNWVESYRTRKLKVWKSLCQIIDGMDGYQDFSLSAVL